MTVAFNKYIIAYMTKPVKCHIAQSLSGRVTYTIRTLVYGLFDVCLGLE